MINLNPHIETKIVNPSLTKADFVAGVNAGKRYDGFRGGLEASLEEAALYTYMFNGEERELLKRFPYTLSVDGLSVLIRICKPNKVVDGVCKNWYVANAEILDEFLLVKPVEDILTKSEFNTLLGSAKYVAE